MRKFKEFNNRLISEGSTAISTDAEEVIVGLWNIFQKTPNITYKQFQSLRGTDRRIITRFIDRYAGQKPSKTKPGLPKKDEAYGVLYRFGKLLVQKGGSLSGKASHAGSSKPPVSNKWKELTGKSKDTSKSDLIIGSHGISVKNGAGARLMSGAVDETKATIVAAMKLSGAEESIKKEMMALVSRFATSTEIHISEALPLGTTTDLAKADASTLKLDVNKKAKAIFEEADSVRNQCKDLFTKVFSTSNVFKQAFAYEASTGWEKFGGKVFGTPGDDSARADYMLAFSPNFSRVRFEHMGSVRSKVVKHIANQMSFSADMKSGRFPSKGAKKGYRFFQTFQLGLKTEFSKADELTTKTNEEIQMYENLLAESQITELQMIDRIKSLVSKAWEGLKSIFGKVRDLIKGFINQLTNAVSEGIAGITSFFGFDFSVSHNTEFNLL